MKNLSKYTFKKKWVWAAIISVIFLCWKLAIQPTLAEYSSLKVAKKQLTLLENATTKRKTLLERNKKDDSLSGSIYGDMDPRQILLKQVSLLCSNTQVNLLGFEEPNVKQEAGLKTLVYRLTFSGDFIKLVRLLSDLENKYQSGKVISVRFFTVEDLLKKEKELYMETWIRNVTTKLQ